MLSKVASKHVHPSNNCCLLQIHLTLPSMSEGLFVTVQPGHERRHWKLIYAGDFSSEDKGIIQVVCVARK
jgi:hypothetical protein